MTVGIASKLSPATCLMHVRWHSSPQDLPMVRDADATIGMGSKDAVHPNLAESVEC